MFESYSERIVPHPALINSGGIGSIPDYLRLFSFSIVISSIIYIHAHYTGFHAKYGHHYESIIHTHIHTHILQVSMVNRYRVTGH